MTWTRAGFVLAILAAAAVSPAQTADPAAAFEVSGTAHFSVTGTPCCGRSEVPGTFSAAYSVDAAGNLHVTGLSAELEDFDIPVPGFLGIGSVDVPLRCAKVSARHADDAFVDATGAFTLSAVELEGQSASDWEPDGSCSASGFAIAATSSGPLSGRHDPIGDRFTLDGRFTATRGSNRFDIEVHLQGHFTNHPPVASLGLYGRGLEQGGCPVHLDDTNPPRPVIEANDPVGLLVHLRSTSTDADGLWPRADVVGEHWSVEADGHSTWLASGEAVGPVQFRIGPLYGVRLRVQDRKGVEAATACTFRVVDTAPPVVSPPTPLTLECAGPDGLTAAGSAPIAAFLDGARADDAADAAPTLYAEADGAVVTSTTVFRPDHSRGGPTPVVFRAKDRNGNRGRGDSSISIVDTTPPAATATASPRLLPPTRTFVPITVAVDARDACGGVAVTLVSITSNDPAWDAFDVSGASFGTDDRSFALAAFPAAGNAPRIFDVTYRLEDESGNRNLATARVVVKGE